MNRLILMILISNLSSAQSLNDLNKSNSKACIEASFGSAMVFINHMNENKIDSAKFHLNKWETNCGLTEPIFRAKILLALYQNEFQESLLAPGALQYFQNYHARTEMIKNSNYLEYNQSKSNFGYIPPGYEFDNFTKTFAKSLIPKYDASSFEYLLVSFYAENPDSLFYNIQNKQFKEYTVSKEYENEVSKNVKLHEIHMAFISGIWIPTGQLKLVGNHPDLGYQIGIKKMKMNYDLILMCKFLDSPNEYLARRTKSGNSLELTNHFFGLHLGVDVGRDIFSKNGHEIQVTGGLAFDGFDVLEEDIDNNIEAESARSFNFSFGLSYRYYLTNSFYLGLRTKYNVVDYTQNNVIDLNGNVFTIQFTIGGVFNDIRNQNLKALKYKQRR